MTFVVIGALRVKMDYSDTELLFHTPAHTNKAHLFYTYIHQSLDSRLDQ